MAVEVTFPVWKWSKQKGARLLLLVAIADYANAEGIAWPSVKSLSQRTRMSPRYVQKMLREIEEDGELEIVKRTSTSNVYRVRIQQPPADQLPGELQFTPSLIPASPRGEPGVAEGVNPASPYPSVPVKEPSSPKLKEDEISLDAQAFVEWFLQLLVDTGAKITSPTPSVRGNWAKCYDLMIRRDGRTKEQIETVCTWARNDNFWRGNFMSPMKLRDKKDGVSYFDRFLNRINSPNGHSSHQQRSSRWFAAAERDLPVLATITDK